jgi:hypothetical protein
MDLFGTTTAWPLLAWCLVGALVLAGTVAVDARERGQSALLWFIVALLLPGFGALAYLVRRAPAPGAETSHAPRPPATPEAHRPATPRTPLVIAPGRESAASGPTGRDVSPGSPADAPGVADAPPALAPAREPAATASGPGPRIAPPPAVAAERQGSGNTLEWRRGVGVIPSGEPAERPSVPPPPVRPAPQRRSPLPPWLVGGVAAVAVLVLLGALGLSRLGPVGSGPQATPTAAPRPSPPAVAAPETTASAPEPAPEPTRPSTYVVEPGDSLGGIARELGTTIDALMAANNLDDADTLYIGQELVVPPQ